MLIYVYIYIFPQTVKDIEIPRDVTLVSMLVFSREVMSKVIFASLEFHPSLPLT